MVDQHRILQFLFFIDLTLRVNVVLFAPFLSAAPLIFTGRNEVVARSTPKGEIERDQSRPTPKGEIEGDQIQAHTKGVN